MANYRAKYNNLGFRNRYWEKGQIASNVSKEELKDSRLCHFEKIDNFSEDKQLETNEPVNDDNDEKVSLYLLQLKEDYQLKFKREVPNRYKNDSVWIKSRLDEEENNGSI